MNKSFLLFVALFVSLNSLHAQEFSFEMHFEDSAGNLDTIVLGYDALGTLYIDSIFGEQDILYGTKKSGLDVRVVQNIYNISSIDTIATKKQILPLDCDIAWPYIDTRIEVTTNNWPLTASWDKTLFPDSCRLFSLFTSVHPGGWFDTGSPSDLWIVLCKDSNSVSFTSQVDDYNGSANINENYAYLDAFGDTVSIFWFTFNYDFPSGIENKTLAGNSVTIFPNPGSDHLYFTNTAMILSMKCFTTDGRQVEFVTEGDHADVSTLPQGIYFLQMHLKNGQLITRRLVKE